jgi:hypothetical protein
MRESNNNPSFLYKDKEKDREIKNQYNSINYNDSKSYLNENEIKIISQKEKNYKQYEKKIDKMINEYKTRKN